MVQPRVPHGVRVYAIGDVHGRADLLEAVFGRIDREETARAPALTFTVLLGDYIDRGARSREVIDAILARRSTARVIALSGNHEEMLLGVLDGRYPLDGWLRAGGLETLRSYGVAMKDLAGVDDVRRFLHHQIPSEHIQFLRSLGDSFTCGDYHFVHAGVRPTLPINAQSRADLLWIREPFLNWDEPMDHVIVHGHTPAPEPDIRRNRINIDTGAFTTGVLTCLCLEGTDIRFL